MSRSIFDKNYYELFNVSEDASEMEIKKAFARLVRQYSNETHPEEFMHIRKAYEVLTNPSKRAEYDRLLQQAYANTYEEATYSSSDSYDAYGSSRNETTETYSDTYDRGHSYGGQDFYDNDYTYDDADTHNRYDSTYGSDQYGSGQYNRQTYQPNHGSTVYTEEKPRGQYSLIGNIIFSIIIGFLFTPLVGIITGVVIHMFKIPIMKVVGCLFWLFVAIIVLGFLLEFI